VYSDTGKQDAAIVALEIVKPPCLWCIHLDRNSPIGLSIIVFAYRVISAAAACAKSMKLSAGIVCGNSGQNLNDDVNDFGSFNSLDLFPSNKEVLAVKKILARIYENAKTFL